MSDSKKELCLSQAHVRQESQLVKLIVCRHSSTSMRMPREDKWCLISRTDLGCPVAAVADHNAAWSSQQTAAVSHVHAPPIHRFVKEHKLTSSAGPTMSWMGWVS